MHVNPVKLLAVKALRQNAANPKKSLGARYARGLRASLDHFGFAGLLVVAANADETYEIMDGNTRLEELQAAGVAKVPCAIVAALAEGQPDWQAERVKFCLAHDRHRKLFDEDAVLRQLKDLAGAGQDPKELSKLAGVDNLTRLLAEAKAKGQPPAPAAAGGKAPAAPEAQGSLVLYGPASVIREVQDLLAGIRTRMTTLEKVRSVLGQAAEFLTWDDEQVLACVLAAVGAYQKRKAGG